MKTLILGGVLAAGLMATPAFAQSSAGAWSDVPDRFQIDAGYFNISANTVLRYNAGAGLAGDIDFEKDLGLNQDASTFWVDGTWRVGRRHQVKLAFTRLSRNRDAFSLQRDFTWGGEGLQRRARGERRDGRRHSRRLLPLRDRTQRALRDRPCDRYRLTSR